ncbi:MAG: ankyrin repeat domain-containing protein [Spirochaetaceae bacterium]|nr:ankyrin repeat domain-containing protein [Spirochaetaceae bacterium]
MTVHLNFGTFEINSDEFTEIKGSGSVYWIIAANSIKDAYKIREEEIPKDIQERFIYWEVRTSGNDIIGRDSSGNYDEIISEPDILEEIRRNNPEGVKKWLDYGLNPNSLIGRYPNIFSPLILACQYGHFDIVRLLVESGADVNFISRPMYSTTALLEACRHGYSEICEYLLTDSANTDHKDAEGWDARAFAEHFNHSKILQLLDTKSPENKTKNEVDKFDGEKNIWICGKCNTSNALELDFCKKCKKEFNPPL